MWKCLLCAIKSISMIPQYYELYWCKDVINEIYTLYVTPLL